MTINKNNKRTVIAFPLLHDNQKVWKNRIFPSFFYLSPEIIIMRKRKGRVWEDNNTSKYPR